MVIEHTFVTTLDAPQAMHAASEMLGRRGFVSETGSGFTVGQAQWDRLDMRRGKKAARAKSVSELPQRVHVGWDRGRVTVAMAIEPSAVWGGSAWNLQLGFGVSSGTNDGSPKKMRLHTDLLMSIARSLEQLLANRQPPEVAMQEWDQAEAAIAVAARKRRIRMWIVAGVIITVFAALIAFIAVAVNAR
ncbi:MAG: hypothetical protein H7Z14_00525 [Anaerolineae bacterium]|nr:hypothetical protein [Phycisphaerae bacterium]